MLDEAEVENETNLKVKKMKLFTISGGPYRSELNLKSKLTPEVCHPFDLCVIETGVNDISNLNSLENDEVNRKILTKKVNELVALAAKIATAGTQVILLKRIPRLDEKVKWNEFMDKKMIEAVNQLNISTVQVEDLKISCEGYRDELELFGAGTKVCDKIHLRGVSGSRVFTYSFVQLFRSLVLTKVVHN